MYIGLHLHSNKVIPSFHDVIVTIITSCYQGTLTWQRPTSSHHPLDSKFVVMTTPLGLYVSHPQTSIQTRLKLIFFLQTLILRFFFSFQTKFFKIKLYCRIGIVFFFVTRNNGDRFFFKNKIHPRLIFTWNHLRWLPRGSEAQHVQPKDLIFFLPAWNFMEE